MIKQERPEYIETAEKFGKKVQELLSGLYDEENTPLEVMSSAAYIMEDEFPADIFNDDDDFPSKEEVKGVRVYLGPSVESSELNEDNYSGRAEVKQDMLQAVAAGLNHIVVVEGYNNCITADRHCLLYTSPSPRDQRGSRMPSSA